MEGRTGGLQHVDRGQARHGAVAPDKGDHAYLQDRPKSPKGELWDQARRHWDTLRSDEGAHFVRGQLQHRRFAADRPGAQARRTWLRSSARCPRRGGRAERAEALFGRRARLWGPEGREKISIAIDRVFIGSCTNGRIEDLRAAAAIANGHKVSERVNAMVVPGSRRSRGTGEQIVLNLPPRGGFG